MKPSSSGRRLLTTCAIAAFAGCGTATQPPGPGAIAQGAARAAHGSAGSFVYAAQCCGLFNSGAVTVYDPGLAGIARRVTGKQLNPIVIAVDGVGTLYVLDQSAGYEGGISVTEFGSGSTRPSRRITGLYWGVTLALDPSNDLYVANCNTCVDSGRGTRTTAPDSIAVYAPGSTSLMRTITQGVHVPRSVAVDAAGYVYVANAGSVQPPHPASVSVYSPGSTSLLRTVKKGITDPQFLTTDNAGNVFLVNEPSEVIEFAPQLTTVLRTITDGIASPEALAIDASGALYVANTDRYPSKGWVSVYAAGSSGAEYRIVKGVNDPVALAADGAGDLYVANNRWDLPGKPVWISEYLPNERKPSRSAKTRKFGGTTSMGLGSQ